MSRAYDDELERSSALYEFEHLEGYGGHIPQTSRNAGKVGQTFKHVSPFAQLPNLHRSLDSSYRVVPHYPAGDVSRQYNSSERCREVSPPESRATSVHGYQHLEGYGGHIPLTERNAGKYGKSFLGPSEDPSQHRHWSHFAPVQRPQTYQHALVRSGEGSCTSRASSYNNFHHLEGYGGHIPATSRNRGKYGKTFSCFMNTQDQDDFNERARLHWSHMPACRQRTAEHDVEIRHCRSAPGETYIPKSRKEQFQRRGAVTTEGPDIRSSRALRDIARRGEKKAERTDTGRNERRSREEHKQVRESQKGASQSARTHKQDRKDAIRQLRRTLEKQVPSNPSVVSARSSTVYSSTDVSSSRPSSSHVSRRQ